MDAFEKWIKDYYNEHGEEAFRVGMRAAVEHAYLNSIPEWPADLTRERLEWLANEDYNSWSDRSDALRRLAAIAPKREKRKVELWNHESWTSSAPPHAQYAGQSALTDGKGGWRKVGEVEIDA